MPYQDIARIIPSIQATHLLGKNVELVKKKKAKTKDMIEMGVTNIAGTGLIQATAQLID